MPSAPYSLVDGKAKIQIEDILGTNPGGGWVYQAAGAGNNPGAEGAHYYYKSQTQQGSYKTAPEEGRFAITVDIEKAGIYGLLLRVSRDTSDPPDARNDIWIQVDGNTNAVMPEGTPALTQGGGGFVKFKSSPPAGTWSDAKTFSTPVEGDANALSNVVLDKGLHTIVFAPRSTGFHIDSLQVVTRSLLPVDPETVTVSSAIASTPNDFETLQGASSDDLDLGRVNGNANTVGLRFTGFDIEAGAEIESAYFVFTASAAATATGSLNIQLHSTLNARDFVAGVHLDDRTYLDETVAWDVKAWEKDRAHRSADISDLIETLVAGGGLEAEDALAFRLTGTGTRSAYSFDGAGAAPELVINYVEPA